MRWTAVLAVCAAIWGCEASNRADDEAKIRALTKEWVAAEAAKDLDKCVSFYADDGERMATGSPLIKGKEALRAEWSKYLATPGSFTWATAKVDIARSGEMAYETGTFEMKAPDGKSTRGKYVIVWRKQSNGTWKVVEDIDNPDS
jgi:uncharacterized protein (TIGR02246 family)